jgi:hypothetical protein
LFKIEKNKIYSKKLNFSNIQSILNCLLEFIEKKSIRGIFYFYDAFKKHMEFCKNSSFFFLAKTKFVIRNLVFLKKNFTSYFFSGNLIEKKQIWSTNIFFNLISIQAIPNFFLSNFFLEIESFFEKKNNDYFIHKKQIINKILHNLFKFIIFFNDQTIIEHWFIIIKNKTDFFSNIFGIFFSKKFLNTNFIVSNDFFPQKLEINRIKNRFKKKISDDLFIDNIKSIKKDFRENLKFFDCLSKIFIKKRFFKYTDDTFFQTNIIFRLKNYFNVKNMKIKLEIFSNNLNVLAIVKFFTQENFVLVTKFICKFWFQSKKKKFHFSNHVFFFLLYNLISQNSKLEKMVKFSFYYHFFSAYFSGFNICFFFLQNKLIKKLYFFDQKIQNTLVEIVIFNINNLALEIDWKLLISNLIGFNGFFFLIQIIKKILNLNIFISTKFKIPKLLFLKNKNFFFKKKKNLRFLKNINKEIFTSSQDFNQNKFAFKYLNFLKKPFINIPYLFFLSLIIPEYPLNLQFIFLEKYSNLFLNFFESKSKKFTVFRTIFILESKSHKMSKIILLEKLAHYETININFFGRSVLIKKFLFLELILLFFEVYNIYLKIYLGKKNFFLNDKKNLKIYFSKSNKKEKQLFKITFSNFKKSEKILDRNFGQFKNSILENFNLIINEIFKRFKKNSTSILITLKDFCNWFLSYKFFFFLKKNKQSNIDHFDYNILTLKMEFIFLK